MLLARIPIILTLMIRTTIIHKISNNIGVASSFLIHRGISKSVHPHYRSIQWKNVVIQRQQVQTSSNNNNNIPSTIHNDDNTLLSPWLESGSVSNNEDDNVVLKSVYETIQNVRNHYQNMLQEHTMKNKDEDFVLPKNEFRESLGVTKRLEMKLHNLAKNNDCPRCWMQRKHCICSQCPTIVSTINTNNILPNIRNLFVIVHHKEIGLVVDTAKVLYMAFPNTKCHIIISGIEPQFQRSMSLLQERFQSSIQKYNKTKKQHSCFVLFPSSEAVPFSQLTQQHKESEQISSKLEMQIKNNIVMNTMNDKNDTINMDDNDENRWDVVVIDGTWSQANKIHSKIPTEIPRVCLSDEAVELLGATGYQLRRHVIPWRQISTLEATRLLFRDMHPPQPKDDNNERQPWDVLFDYQLTAKDAAKKQLGPPREKKSKSKSKK